MRLKKYLITGGCGFIGSHLAEVLIAEGHQVVALDDLSTGSIQNVEHLRQEEAFQYVLDSVENESLLAELISEADAIYHLAAAVGVRIVVEEPIRTISTNIRTTELVLQHASKRGKPVLLTSTSEVYGKGVRIPFSEEDDLVYGPTTRSRWSYAFSKAIDEFLALAHYRTRGLPVFIVRLFNTVGPRQTGNYGMVIPRFVQQALTGQPITVYGDGKQTRCFCHVRDVVGALAQLMQRADLAGKIFNLGSDQPITMLELAKLVNSMVGSTAPIQFIPYEKAYASGFEDMVHRQPDISRIKAAISFCPSRNLQQIVEDVVKFMRNQDMR